MSQLYGHDFYVTRCQTTRYAADKGIIILKEYIAVSSVANVGGEVGTWLKTFQKIFGVASKDFFLLEGDYVKKCCRF